MKKAVLLAILAFASALAGQARATCFFVYRGSNLLVQSSRAPVDMSLPLSTSVPARFGAGTALVFANMTPCPEISNQAAARPAAMRSVSTARKKARRPRH